MSTAEPPTGTALRLLAYASARNVAAMQAAYIEWARGDGADHGMSWIGNTLYGPGLIPGDTTSTAQEFFDREMEKLDLLYPDVTKNPAIPIALPAAAVADGLERDSNSLEQSE